MAQIRQALLDSIALVPDDIRGAIRRRAQELIGLAMIVAAACAALALATWSVRDPSLSHATSAPVRNLLGFPGAIAADLLIQLLGIAAVALILPVAVWGWQLVTHRAVTGERLR